MEDLYTLQISFLMEKNHPHIKLKIVSPLNVYGKSESNGERLISKLNNTTIVEQVGYTALLGKTLFNNVETTQNSQSENPIKSSL